MPLIDVHTDCTDDWGVSHAITVVILTILTSFGDASYGTSVAVAVEVPVLVLIKLAA
jgi:hypothetical protein